MTTTESVETVSAANEWSLHYTMVPGSVRLARIHVRRHVVLGVWAAPSPHEVEELTWRLRAVLIPLGDDLLRESPAGTVYAAAEAVGRAAALRTLEAPTEFVAARAYARRLALAALDMLDLLAEATDTAELTDVSRWLA
ncbi:DUF6415 family natural product biosynthesis protein [Streptomyces sp. NPDC093109]|uniref:DUF6415 family natural product biosynthesis protein n=1 Tax=Streptomyces sp. NPDC093109 TaxID=3154977 RepID=UPI003450823F